MSLLHVRSGTLRSSLDRVVLLSNSSGLLTTGEVRRKEHARYAARYGARRITNGVIARGTGARRVRQSL